MIAGQLRGMKFRRSQTADRWPMYGSDAAEANLWQDMDETFGMSSGEAEVGTAYSLALTKEGAAFRQRFIDYHLPEEAGA